MEVKSIEQGLPQKPQTKGEKAAERMQKEYLYQIQQGKSNKQSLLESLKTLDDNYQPEYDCFEYCSIGAFDRKASFKLPSRDTVSKVLDFIVKVGPIIYELFNQICNLVPKKGDNDENLATVEYSTTA